MTQGSAFLSDILEHPDDDTPRLIYADWLDDHGQPERAEFIRIQCELEGMAEGDARRPERKARERQLLRDHEDEWAGPLRGLVASWSFRRGFVESIEVEGEKFLRHAEDIFRLAPVQRADFGSGWDDALRVLPLLAACPHLARLKAVHLSFGCYFISDRGLQVLASLSPLLQRLEKLLVLECNITEAGLGPLAMSPHLLRLRRLHLCECGLCGAAGVRPLAGSPHLKRLASLSLAENDLGDSGVRALAKSPNCRLLESLDLRGCGVGRAGAGALAGSPHLGRLALLMLSDNPLGEGGAAALASSPHLGDLVYLHLQGTGVNYHAKERLKARFGERVYF